MRNLWERLDAIRAIVDTTRADDLERQPDSIRTRYEPYANAYFPIEAVRRLERRLISELRASRAVTGYLSADFGYGKTATAVYLWNRCLQQEIVAVPPFLFRELRHLMQATKGWLAYQLQHAQPTLVPKLEEVYRQRVGRSIDELAEEIASKQGVSKAKALAIVQEYIARHRGLTSTESLLSFLHDASEIAREAGFKGLVVFADEIQEFLRTEERAREAIQTLSELVKGIRAMVDTPLALMFAMPAHPTEAAIEGQAGDIMHRMRERETALRLEDAYGREFPKQLWEHLCERFGDATARKAVDDRTLEAMGQICERKDLSNGPRTVINAFKRIAQHWQQNRRPYTPVDMIDDYLQGHIVFEGREAKLTGTVRALLDSPAVQRDPRRQQTVKLLAAFPRGVDQSRAESLYPVIEDLADKEGWLGEHITQLSEGYALVGLQERVEARPLLDEVVRDFRRRWYHIWDDHTKAQLAADGFLIEILPMLFPPRAPGQYANFGGHRKKPEDFERDAHGVPYVIFDGSFERLYSRFPNRKVCVAVSIHAEALIRFQPPADDIDVDFRFFLELPDGEVADETPCRIKTTNQDRRIDFHLNLKRAFGRQFPTDLMFLHDIMSPERTSAQVLLGLSMRMWDWLEEHPDVSEADRQMMESQRRALHRFALQLLLPDARKIETIGIDVTGAERTLVESAFERKCAELYPNYRPLMVTKEWRSYLRRYRDALSKRPLAERRGRQPFAGTKGEVAGTFGWGHSAFEAQSTNLRDMRLLELLDWTGRGEDSEASVLFMEHALEALLRETLVVQGHSKTVRVAGQGKLVKEVELSRLYQVARKEGYLRDEVDEALELLQLRQYTQRTTEGTVQEFAGALDADELTHQSQELEEHLNQLEAHFGDELRSIVRLLQEARQHLATPDDEVALDAAQRGLQEVRARLEQFIETKAQALKKELENLATSLERRQRDLEPGALREQVKGAVEFERHVDDQRKALDRGYRQLKKQWDDLHAEADREAKNAPSIRRTDALARAAESEQNLRARAKMLEEELRQLQPYLTGLQHWREIVTKATVLRDRLEPDSPLRQELDEVGIAVMENFADQRLNSLLHWERFKAEIDEVEAKLSAEENRRRNEFHECKEQYEQALGCLIPQRMVQAIFDPADPEQSYQVLYTGVLRKMQEWLQEQFGYARRFRDEFEYLIRERGMKVESELNFAQRVLEDLEQFGGLLDQDLVAELAQFQRYCGELKEHHEQLRTVQEKLVKKRAEKEPPTDEEKPLLEVLTTQRRSLEEVRRQLPDGMPLEDIFGRLKSLYRKGHLEIEVRKRE